MQLLDHLSLSEQQSYSSLDHNNVQVQREGVEEQEILLKHHEEVAQGWDYITHMAVLQSICILHFVIAVTEETLNSERGDAT